MYRIAVCDDETAAAEQTAEMIRKWNRQIDVSCFRSGEELLQSYSYYHVKNVSGGIIFLDNGAEIPIAQKKQKIWKQELLSYLAERLEGKK